MIKTASHRRSPAADPYRLLALSILAQAAKDARQRRQPEVCADALDFLSSPAAETLAELCDIHLPAGHRWQ